MAAPTRKSGPCLSPRLRIISGRNIAFGPGKAALLDGVAQTGSIGRAAARMGMSYMRAWSLIQTMNQCFKEPLVLAAHGGHGGGGAELTATGRKVLDLYHRMERASARAAAGPWKRMRGLLAG
ncbi:MAG: LysR family transcriptional regulator [Verrucomicrobia bacterium]|nr:LysR family transcriptional regulator [Verrucomicrobiota bacterium]MDE3097877.1 LysR family transcriptional regulator [Verrucomicrobiota bacterium]